MTKANSEVAIQRWRICSYSRYQEVVSCCLVEIDCRHRGHVLNWIAHIAQNPLKHIQDISHFVYDSLRTGYCLDWQYALTAFARWLNASMHYCWWLIPTEVSYLAPRRWYGGVVGHIFTFDSWVPLFNVFVCGENLWMSQFIMYRQKLVFWLHCCCRQYGSNFSQYDIAGSEAYRFWQKTPQNGRNVVQGQWRSLILVLIASL